MFPVLHQSQSRIAEDCECWLDVELELVTVPSGDAFIFLGRNVR